MKDNHVGKIISGVGLIVVLLVGIGLICYPSLSNTWNELKCNRVIEDYKGTVSKYNPEDLTRIREEARQYNSRLYAKGSNMVFKVENSDEYMTMLNPDENGVMGYIDIDKINVHIPICHGVTDEVLQNNIGHIEGTSLPIGGENTHVILSGHRGLPSAKLFTRLDEMEVGDIFKLNILDETSTYQVEDINVVLPEEVNRLSIIEGQDEVTLMTCTPYGVNSHRLLLTGKRIHNIDSESPDVLNNILENSDLPWWVILLIILVVLVIIYIIIKYLADLGK